ncbi:uncharacterized protein LOC128184945 [Crassostrea angulata]|uniref:uncharacterized protein LOC128184945 n=1 Tax=Magallana angulata TaxID=2784310 RepID=UPI0022B13AF9|nr:uncharacterized protein LOC128184945 [Crassostrea angulata]
MDFFHVKMLTVFSLIFFMNVHINRGYNTTCPLPRKCTKSYRSNHFNEIICTECLPGYYGSCCNYTCRYPNYGKECQSECMCDEENYNHIIGYVQRTSNETFWTTNPPLNKTKTNITYVLHEHTTFKKELYLSYQEDESWHKNKVLFYFIIGLLFIAVLLVCLHIILCFVD